MSPRKVAECGTQSGYHRHRKNGEDACTACKAAMAKYQRERTARRREAVHEPAPVPRLQGEIRLNLPAEDGLLAAKALAYYARTLRSTQASHIAGATAAASASERLRDQLLLSLKTLQGGRS